MKICFKCCEIKEITEFNKNKNREDGLETRCKNCASKEYAEYTKRRKAAGVKKFRNPERERRTAKQWRDENPERVKAKYKKYWYRKMYGITHQQYKDMLRAQNFSCKLCETPQSNLKRSLAVDHCHTTGVVRGLLCGNCNTAIGKFNDDPIMFLKAIRYLKANQH